MCFRTWGLRNELCQSRDGRELRLAEQRGTNLHCCQGYHVFPQKGGWRPPSHVPTREVVPPVLNIITNLEPWVRSFVSPAQLGHWDTKGPFKRFWFIPHVSFGALNPYIAASWSWGEGRAPLRGVGKGHPQAWNQHPSYRTIPAHPHGPWCPVWVQWLWYLTDIPTVWELSVPGVSVFSSWTFSRTHIPSCYNRSWFQQLLQVGDPIFGLKCSIHLWHQHVSYFSGPTGVGVDPGTLRAKHGDTVSVLS